MPSELSAAGHAMAVSNAINRLHSEYHGRGAASARTIIDRNYVVCFLDDIYTAVERTLIEAGHEDTVRETRGVFQLTMRTRFSEAVEQIMGRKVVGFMSQVSFDPDMAAEVFILERNGSDAAADIAEPIGA
jgi:uncharacterized protein YbcI